MICDTIKALRDSIGISQSELARRIGVTRSSVNAWEMGLSVPTAQYIVELSQLFHVTSDYLLGLSEQETFCMDSFTNQQKRLLYEVIKYFEQEKGITIYPGTNGDTNINGFVDGIFETKTLEPGMIIDRYGSNGTGKYFSPLGTPYSERALPPYMKNEPYTKYKVLVSFEVKSGEIVPWFDEVGGGTQYLSTYLVDELKKFGYIVEVE